MSTRIAPTEVSDLLHLSYEHKSKELDAISGAVALQHLSVFENYLKAQYDKWFPKAKPCRDHDIANHVFQMTWKDEKTRVKYEMAGLRGSVQRTAKEFANMLSPTTTIPDAYEKATNVLGLLGSYAMDAIGLLGRGEAEIDKQTVPYGFGQRNVLSSLDVFKMSCMMLGGMIWDPVEARTTAVFLIRQALELRIKEALGIHAVIDSTTGEPAKITAFAFLEILQENEDKISLPINWTIFNKIVTWTNSTIHNGWMHPAWQVEFAQEILSPLFKWGQHGTFKSSHGAVKVTQSFLDNLETVFKDSLRLRDKKIQEQIHAGTHTHPDKYDVLTIEKAKPGAIVVDSLPVVP